MILNMTQHTASQEQLDAGVVDLSEEWRKFATEQMTFSSVPDESEMLYRASTLADIAEEHGADAVMIGGAPFFMSTLERALVNKGIAPVYAFSQRESVETVTASGDVVKKSVFRHIGFVEVQK